MKNIATKDQHSRPIAVQIPADQCLMKVTVGAFGWSATTRAKDGWRYQWHNGQLIGREHDLRNITESGIFQSSNTRKISMAWWQAAFGHLKVSFSFA